MPCGSVALAALALGQIDRQGAEGSLRQTAIPSHLYGGARQIRRYTMLYPLILWLLGVPLVLMIVLMLLGIV